METGGQPTATAGRTDLEAVARGCGIAEARTVTREDEIPALKGFLLESTGPALAVVKVVAESLPLAFPHSFDGAVAINRFRDAALR